MEEEFQLMMQQKAAKVQDVLCLRPSIAPNGNIAYLCAPFKEG